jgi:hypothetical protein
MKLMFFSAKKSTDNGGCHIGAGDQATLHKKQSKVPTFSSSGIHRDSSALLKLRDASMPSKSLVSS